MQVLCLNKQSVMKKLLTLLSGFISLASFAQPKHIKDSLPQTKIVSGQTAVVTAQKSYISMQAGKTTLSVQESAALSGSNAWDIVSTAPGIIVSASGSMQYMGKPVVVYADGKPLNIDGDNLKEYLTAMSGASIDKAEIITAPSAKYNADGAVIVNIKMLKNKNFGTNGTVTAGAGAGRYERFNTSLQFNNRNKRRNLYGGADINHTHTYVKNNSERSSGQSYIFHEESFEQRNRYNQSFRLGADYDLSKKTSMGYLVKMSYNYRARNTENITRSGHPAFPDGGYTKAVTAGNARFATPTLNLFLKTAPGGRNKKELNIQFDYFRYNKSWADDIDTRFYTADNITEYQPAYLLRSHTPADNRVISSSADYTVTLKKGGSIETGIKTIFTRTDNNALWEEQVNSQWIKNEQISNRFVFNENINAAYISYSGKIKKLGIQAGLRAEQTNTNGRSFTLATGIKNHFFHVFPSLNLLYTINAKRMLLFNAKSNITRYSYEYLNPFMVYQSQFSYSQGNPYLRPETSRSADLTLICKYQLFFSLVYSGSSKSLGPVFRTDNSGRLMNTYDNIGNWHLMGFSTAYNKTFFKKLTLTASASAIYLRNNIPGNSTSAFSVVSSATGNIKLPKKTTADFSLTYRSPLVSGIFTMRSLFYSNIGIARPVFKEKVTMKLGITDLFNTNATRMQITNYQGLTGNFTGKTETRFITLSATYKFGNKNVKAAKQRKTGIEEERTRVGSD